MNKSTLIVSSLLAAFLAACNNPPAPPPPAAVAKVSIAEQSVLLEGLNVSRSLQAKAFDASNNAVVATITYTSSKPSVIAVDATGKLTALQVGSAQITAIAGGVRSNAVMVAAAQLDGGVANIASDKVISGPTFDPPDQKPVVGSSYTVVVEGLTPTIGKKWFSHGKNGASLEGKIKTVEDLGSNRSKVTLEIVPLKEIFQSIKIDEEIDYSNAVSSSVPDVDFVGSSVLPKIAPQAFLGFGPLACELSNVGATPPISLNVPSMNVGLTMDAQRTRILVDISAFSDPDVVQIRMAGNLNANLNLSGSINRNFSGSVDCRVASPISTNLAGIPLPFLVSLGSERGLGIKMSGSVNGPSTTFRAQGTYGVAFDLGVNINLTTGTATPFNTITPTASTAFTVTNTGSPTTRLNLTVSPYAYDNWVARAGIGNASIAFDLWASKNGITMDANLASLTDTLNDTNFQSNYFLKRFQSTGPGREFRDLLDYFDAGSFLPPATNGERIIHKGAAGTVICLPNGDARRCILVILDENIPVLGYNITKAEVYRRRGNINTLLVSNTAPSGGSIRVDFPSSQVQAGDTCIGVVYTKALPGFPLEVGSDNCI